MSSKVFRKHFLNEPIVQINPTVRKVAEYTIHGGRANTFTKIPTVILNVKMYDYNSFYPYAMTKLPPMTKGEWYLSDFKNEQHLEEYLNAYEGFFQVSGYVEKCKYPIILKNPSTLDYANGEKIKNVWVSSYELREALRNNEIHIEFDKLEAYIWKPDKDATNPFRDYVEYFYKLKNDSEKDSLLYLANKLLLNALYGKTYQAIRQPDYSEEPTLVWKENLQKCIKNKILYRAGGIYLPHVGSWITSLCRAQLHADLHKYEALDCATDSFKTVHTVQEGDKLGDLKLVCEGLLLLLRPKLYVMFSKEIQREVMEQGDLREWLKTSLPHLDLKKDIVRYALHGFWGNVHDLLELYRDKTLTYEKAHDKNSRSH